MACASLSLFPFTMLEVGLDFACEVLGMFSEGLYL